MEASLAFQDIFVEVIHVQLDATRVSYLEFQCFWICYVYSFG